MFHERNFREFQYPLLALPEDNPFFIPQLDVVDVEYQIVNLFHSLNVPHYMQLTIYPLKLLSLTNLYEAGKFISQAQNNEFCPQKLMNEILELLDGPMWINQNQYLTDNHYGNPIFSPDLRIGALSSYILEMYHLQGGQCQLNPQ